MINKVSEDIAKALARNSIISTENVPFYAYGIELMVLKFIMYGTLLILGAITHTLIITIVFTFSYVSLREFTGGYHCTTPIRCLAVSSLIWFAMFLGYQVGYALISRVYICISLVALIIIFMFAPIASPAKPMSEKQISRSRLLSRTISIFLLIMSVILALLHLLYFSYPISFALLCDSILLVIEKEKQNHEGKNS